MAGQAGLCLINNNYTARGDGRDLLIYYDSGFRGGKMSMHAKTSHLPSPMAGPAKLQRPPGSSLGFGARNEGHQQHLNLSSSSFKELNDKKLRLTSNTSSSGFHSTGSPKETAQRLLMSTTRPRSSPAGNRFVHVFEQSTMVSTGSKPLWATGKLGEDDLRASTGQLMVPAQPGVPEWDKPLPIKSVYGFNRTPNGGYWPS
mmetsp:Transcript_43245/g.111687  ORF Transcript_43245/g.111687 Transcript_43245/m.111687 type:complete len:201 (+) Transcript_43245:206-808(+)